MTEIPEHLLRRAQERRQAIIDQEPERDATAPGLAAIDYAERVRMAQASGQFPTPVPTAAPSDKHICPHGYHGDGADCHTCLVARVDELEARMDELLVAIIKEKYT